MSYPCPCCGYVVFQDSPGSYDICPICSWEDDLSQLRFARMAGGANRPSLLEAQQNYHQLSVSEARLRARIRPPAPEEVRDKGWRLLDPARDNIEDAVPGVDEGQSYPRDLTRLYYWRPGYWRRP